MTAKTNSSFSKSEILQGIGGAVDETGGSPSFTLMCSTSMIATLGAGAGIGVLRGRST